MEFLEKIKTSFRNGSALIQLIYINVAVFLLVWIIGGIITIFNIPLGGYDLKYWLSMPASLEGLLSRPWCILSYMFMHEGVMHLLFNMLWFYWFGQMFQTLYSQRQLVGLYILSGIGGAILFMLIYNFLPHFQAAVNVSTLIGASAAIMGVVIAVATTRPNDEIQLLFIGGIKLKYIAAIALLMDVLMSSESNSGGHISHLGGALIGFLYVRTLQSKSIDITKKINSIIDFFTRKTKKNHNIKVKYKRPSAIIADRKADYVYNQNKVENQKKMDAILDKIKQFGYDSLTKQEKQFLFESSKK